jgi:predicted nucleic acid-binding protein
VVNGQFDTNILIDYLNGLEEARSEIRRYAAPAISLITWMEVMAGTTPGDEGATRAFLARFRLLPVDPAVAEGAVALRRSLRLKLPDAIILATAETHSLLLITRNTKDFPADRPGVRIPYTLR